MASIAQRRHSISNAYPVGRPQRPLRPRSYSLNTLGTSPNTTPIRISEVQKLVEEYVTSERVFYTGELAGHIAFMITQLFDMWFEGKVAAQYDELKRDFLQDAKPDWKGILNFDNLYSALKPTFQRVVGDISPQSKKNTREPEFLALLLEARFIQAILQCIPLHGFVYYTKELFDEMRDCQCGICANVGCRFWPAEHVFHAARFVTSSIDEFPSLSSMRPIRATDLGMPYIPPLFSPVLECSICQEKPALGDRLIQLRACNHVFCSECLLRWANTVPDIEAESVTCPICRTEVEPAGTPYACFNINKRSRRRLYSIFSWCDIPPSHECFGLEFAWEEEEVDACVRVAREKRVVYADDSRNRTEVAGPRGTSVLARV